MFPCRKTYGALVSGSSFWRSFPRRCFSFLKYNGLYDKGPDEPQETAEEELSECHFFISIENSESRISTSGAERLCGVFICENSQCGLMIDNAHGRIRDATSTELLAKLDETYSEQFDQEEEPEGDDAEKKDVEETAPQSDALELYISALNDNRYGYPLWQWLSIFSVAFVMTQLGFLTSVNLSSSKQNAVLYERNFLFSIAYGVICGTLTICLFASGLLQGTLFPTFSGDLENFGFNSIAALKFRGQDWFKLAIWCYIAGFYERFLPSIFRDLMRDARKADDNVVTDAVNDGTASQQESAKQQP